MNISGSFPVFSEENINEIAESVKSMLRSGRLTDGPYIQEFERRFAEYNGAKHALAVSSGTAALTVALHHFKLEGREVVVPTNTFVSTPNAVVYAGGKPVFADTNPATLGIDVEDVKRKVTEKTAGVIVVHVAGLVCPQIRELQEFCKQKGLFLIEDCAHAHGATADEQKAGTFGDVGCFSFYPTKVMTSGEGGMVVTNDAELAEEGLLLRNCGQNSERQMVMLGYNFRFSELAAIVGLNQLGHLEEFLLKRNQIARAYEKALADVSGVDLFKVPVGFRHSYYKYPLLLKEGVDRQRVAAEMREQFGVETGNVYYPPCHLHPYYMQHWGTKLGDLPSAEHVLGQVLCLPMHIGVSGENIKYIGESLDLSINALSPLIGK